ncbi:MAG TPA: enoyl-CoA hydratase/isomerase family protein [Burkholderiaceae bacterium]
MGSPSKLILSRSGSILQVLLDDPATKNALSEQMVNELRAVAQQAADDTGLRCIVLRGARGNFCAGGNLADFQRMMQLPVPIEAADPIAAANRQFGRMLQEWLALPQVVITAVEGAAMGGALGLLAIADIALATGSAQFAMPETGLGLPPAQIAPFLALRIGETQTRRLAMTGARIDGWQALEIGLVGEVHEGQDELDVALQRTLQKVLRNAPRALAATKAILLQNGASALDAALDFAALQFAKALRNGDAAEGVAAFSAKRPATWVDLPSDTP